MSNVSVLCKEANEGPVANQTVRGESWFVSWLDSQSMLHQVGPFIDEQKAKQGQEELEWVMSLLDRGYRKESVLELLLFNLREGHDTAPICQLVRRL